MTNRPSSQELLAGAKQLEWYGRQCYRDDPLGEVLPRVATYLRELAAEELVRKSRQISMAEARKIALDTLRQAEEARAAERACESEQPSTPSQVGPVDEDAKWLRTLKLRDIADRLESQQAEIERLREALHRKQQTWGAD